MRILRTLVFLEHLLAETSVDCTFTEEAGKVGVSLGKAQTVLFVVNEAQGGPHAELGTGPCLNQG